MAFWLLPCHIFPQASQKPATEERLIRLEEGQKSIERRLASLNQRIDDLRSEMSSRFDDMRFWLDLMTTGIIAMPGGLLGLWVYLIKRQPVSGVIGQAAIDHRVAELEAMQKRLAALEAQLEQMQAGPA